MSAELPELYLHLTTWLKNLSVESNKLCGGPQDFKSAYLDQLIDCRSVVCQILSAEVETRRKETLQTVAESLTGQIVNLEKIVNKIQSEGSNTSKTTPETAALTTKEAESQQRSEAISSTIQQSKHSHNFTQVAGLEHVKQTLRESLLLPAQFPALFQGCRAPWRSLLLYGPPGTGKTELARAVSGEADAVFFSVSTSDLISSYVGESERLVRQLFESARNQERQSVIFIDEIDSVCRERSSREEEYSRRVKNELLKQIEGVGTHNGKLFLLCATNCPWELDTAFLRRFERRLYVPLPNSKTRTKLIKMFLKDTAHNISDDDWEMLERATEGYSGSDLKCAVTDAGLIAVRELTTTTHWALRYR
ncbi:uncharacterized protein LOC134817320 isoform X2 [Bolinopsis microptera]|uniref:uncharacterized protein LOC134817320 isoform X2 n=1 Tax=Bolinopsis microptera TaxID=2820187 RepID=UPI003078DEC8